jgi:5-methylcytosine-specific restriction endonuclease McrA
MPTRSRDQSLPPYVRDATSYTLVQDAENVSGSGTKRAGRWPTILKYSGHPDGVAQAKRESGATKRHLHLLERHSQLRFNTSPNNPLSSPGTSSSTSLLPITVTPEDDESRYPEGAKSYRLHRRLERDGTLAKRAKQNRLAQVGALSCDVCGFDFASAFGKLGAGFIEAHHTVPVSTLRGENNTKLSDLALVCSNCHRMLHRGPHLLSVDDLRSKRRPNSET